MHTLPYTSPQFVDQFLVNLGLHVQWPTVITLILRPFLTLAYYRLAMKEEREVAWQFPMEYARYRATVPAFIPKFSSTHSTS